MTAGGLGSGGPRRLGNSRKSIGALRQVRRPRSRTGLVSLLAAVILVVSGAGVVASGLAGAKSGRSGLPGPGVTPRAMGSVPRGLSAASAFAPRGGSAIQ
jgi:hypothetical protein